MIAQKPVLHSKHRVRALVHEGLGSIRQRKGKSFEAFDVFEKNLGIFASRGGKRRDGCGARTEE
jgi:hypothetical protein